MNEIIKAVCQKTGLSEEQGRKATETVIGMLKTKLPAPIAAQLDSFLQNGGKGLGGMMGGMGGGDRPRK